MAKYLSILLLTLAMSLNAFGQSKTVANFISEADGYNIYLYQSLIRVLNKDKNPDFNMLIRNLDHLRLLTTDSTENALATFKGLDRGVQQEGYEEIMSFDNKDYKCHLYEMEDRGGKSSWVATLMVEGRAGIIEMKGSVDMNYLHSFSSLNMDKLQELTDFDAFPQRSE